METSTQKVVENETWKMEDTLKTAPFRQSQAQKEHNSEKREKTKQI